MNKLFYLSGPMRYEMTTIQDDNKNEKLQLITATNTRCALF